MVSLTTVYVLSIILTSIAGIGSAFASEKVGGGVQEPISLLEEPPQIEQEFQSPNTEQIEQEAPLEVS